MTSEEIALIEKKIQQSLDDELREHSSDTRDHLNILEQKIDNKTDRIISMIEPIKDKLIQISTSLNTSDFQGQIDKLNQKLEKVQSELFIVKSGQEKTEMKLTPLTAIGTNIITAILVAIIMTAMTDTRPQQAPTHYESKEEYRGPNGR